MSNPNGRWTFNQIQKQITLQESMVVELRYKIERTRGGYPIDAYAALAHALIGLAALYQAGDTIEGKNRDSSPRS